MAQMQQSKPSGQSGQSGQPMPAAPMPVAPELPTLEQALTQAGSTTPMGTWASLLGPITIKRPTRLTQSKDKKSTKLLTILAPLASLLTFEASVWGREDADGNYIHTIQMPWDTRFPGITISDQAVGMVDQVEAWKDSMLVEGGPVDAYLYGDGKTQTMPTNLGGARLVKRMKVTGK